MSKKPIEELMKLKLGEIRRIASGETNASPEVFREALRLAVLADDMGEEFAEQRREMRRMVNWQRDLQRDLLKALRSPESAREHQKQQLAELDRKARQAEHPNAVLLGWLAKVKRRTATGPCQGITVQRATVAVEGTRGLAAAAAKLTGKGIAVYRKVQRDLSRGRPKKRSAKLSQKQLK